MQLALDIGNTDIHGTVFDDAGSPVVDFRKATGTNLSRDEFGVFLLQVLAGNNVPPEAVTETAIACVVPGIQDAVVAAVNHYLGHPPLVLQAGVKTGLKIKTQVPGEVGADRIANAIAACHLFPDTDRLVIDFGTATTVDAISADNAYLGGVIAAGIGLSMRALATGTAKLPSVAIEAPSRACGRTTATNIQSGLYYGHLGMLKELTARISNEAFAGRRPVVLATGGYAPLFADARLFDTIEPHLVQIGLRRALTLNPT
ncbi:MAG: type III pantothenate kinase [Opitutales bacterium]